MKTFLSGTIGAVIAGLILFFAQSWWAGHQSSGKQRIRFEQQASVTLDKEQLQALLKKMDYRSMEIQIMSVSNLGADDIADKTFSNANEFIWGYGTISNPNGNPKNASLTYDGKVLTARYGLLPVETEHTFWIASGAPALSTSFSNDTTGVHVVSDYELRDSDPFPWIFFGGIGLLLVGAVIGGAMGQAVAIQELAKRGHDYKALTTPDVTVPGQGEIK